VQQQECALQVVTLDRSVGEREELGVLELLQQRARSLAGEPVLMRPPALDGDDWHTGVAGVDREALIRRPQLVVEGIDGNGDRLEIVRIGVIKECRIELAGS
jgi:hypothetical protein